MTEEKQINTTSINDVEKGLPESAVPKRSPLKRTASERLKQLDKKTYVFAGYIFWGILFVAGGATAAALLSQKKVDTPIPTEILSEDAPIEAFPSESSTNFPTNFPSQSPTMMSPLSTLHHSVVEKLNKEFTDCNTISGELNCQWITDNQISIDAKYMWEEGQYTLKEGVFGVGVVASESAPFVKRPMTVTVVAKRKKVPLKQSSSVSITDPGKIATQNQVIVAFNSLISAIFPMTRIIELNQNCGIECFEDSLDNVLEELAGVVKQVDEKLKEFEPFL